MNENKTPDFTIMTRTGSTGSSSGTTRNAAIGPLCVLASRGRLRGEHTATHPLCGPRTIRSMGAEDLAVIAAGNADSSSWGAMLVAPARDRRPAARLEAPVARSSCHRLQMPRSLRQHRERTSPPQAFSFRESSLGTSPRKTVPGLPTWRRSHPAHERRRARFLRSR